MYISYIFMTKELDNYCILETVAKYWPDHNTLNIIQLTIAFTEEEEDGGGDDDDHRHHDLIEYNHNQHSIEYH